MSLSVGIVGLPNVGKSTLFQALTKKQVNISNYPFCTIDPNVGVIAVPDKRLEKLSALVPAAKVLPAVIEVVDVAGLVRGAHQGEGLGNQFLSYLLPMDALLLLVRCFKDKAVASLAEKPEEQLLILHDEFLKKDKEWEKNLLSPKPSLLVGNVRKDRDNFVCDDCQLLLDVKLELELSELSDGELVELGIKSDLSELITALYRLLGLITFYTTKGGKELRAWPVKKGVLAPEAGGVVHSDFQEKFIRAEIIDWQKLIEVGSWRGARERGWLRAVGRDYAVQDGDVIEFKI